MIVHADYRESRLDAAITRGYDPHDDAVDVPGPPLTPEWQAHLDAAIARAKALRAEVAAEAVAS